MRLATSTGNSLGDVYFEDIFIPRRGDSDNSPAYSILGHSRCHQCEPLYFHHIGCLLTLCVQVQLQDDITRASRASVLEGLLLAEELLRHIPRDGLSHRPELTGERQAASRSQPPFAFARSFYGISSLPEPPPQQGVFDVPLASIFENAVSTSLNCVRGLSEASDNPFPLRDVFSQSLLLLERIVDRISASIDLSWNPSEWLHTVLPAINHQVGLCYVKSEASGDEIVNF
jgi:hypothetical protein